MEWIYAFVFGAYFVQIWSIANSLRTIAKIIDAREDWLS